MTPAVSGAPTCIETARLRLTPPGPDDAEAIFNRYASDPEVTRYLGWPRHRCVADTQAFLAFAARQWAQDGVGPYLVRSRGDRRLLGSTGLALEPGPQAMTGYVLARDAWGRGYATEALRAMVDVAEGLGVPRVFALCHPEHRASWRVLEKCGFLRDAAWATPFEFPNLEPRGPVPVVCYARLLPHAGVPGVGA